MGPGTGPCDLRRSIKKGTPMNRSLHSFRRFTRVVAAALAVVTVSLTAAVATGGSAAHAQSSGAGAGKVTFNPFSITRKIDKASPVFFQ